MKVTVTMIKTVTHTSEFEVELPEGMDDYDFAPIVEETVGTCNDVEDVSNVLETKHKFKVGEIKTDSLADRELEVIDIDPIE